MNSTDLREQTAHYIALGFDFGQARMKAKARIKFLEEINSLYPENNTATKGL